MSAIRLRTVLAEHKLEVKHLARHCGLSRTAASRVVNHGVYPARRDTETLQHRIAHFLEERHIAAPDWHQPIDARPKRQRPEAPTPADPKEPDLMVLRKTRITDATRRHFGILRDPFADPQTSDDVFVSQSYRYVREAILDKGKHGGMLAVVGQSGSGKSTLRGDCIEQLRDSNVIVIEPYVIAMGETNSQGVPLRATHIGSAIAREVSPSSTLSGDSDTRFAQLHKMLRESARAGNRHLIIVEEAHAIPKPTLRHLRRFTELRDGLRSLIGLVLIGQQELEAKLSEHDPAVREVVQRTELVHVHPLGADLQPYLQFRFQRAGLDLAKLFDDKAIDAVRTRLADSGTQSLLYPQAVHNLVAMALNGAAALGAPTVSADMVRRV